MVLHLSWTVTPPIWGGNRPRYFWLASSVRSGGHIWGKTPACSWRQPLPEGLCVFGPGNPGPNTHNLRRAPVRAAYVPLGPRYARGPAAGGGGVTRGAGGLLSRVARRHAGAPP